MKLGRNFSKMAALAALCAGTLIANSAARADVDSGLQRQRMQVLAAGRQGSAGLPVLVAAMKSENVMVRRAAVRCLREIGAPAAGALRAALKSDPDVVVRGTALHALMQDQGVSVLDTLPIALNDPSDKVRAAAVQLLASMRPYSPPIEALLKKAQQDSSTQVKLIALQALWPFHTDGVALRDKPAYKDHQLSVAQTIALPLDGWRFQTDPGQIGPDHNWFGESFDDSNWKIISIGIAWDSQIGEQYLGGAWYRRTFTLPAKPDQIGTDIVFDGVDESAWVWINGQYVGQHDIGPGGWDMPFAMDTGDLLKWGAQNQITVRVLNRVDAGGIWKTVHLKVLKQ